MHLLASRELAADSDSFESKIFSVHLSLLRTSKYYPTQLNDRWLSQGSPKVLCRAWSVLARRFLVTQCGCPARVHFATLSAVLKPSNVRAVLIYTWRQSPLTTSQREALLIGSHKCSGSNKQRCDFIDYCYTERDGTLISAKWPEHTRIVVTMSGAYTGLLRYFMRLYIRF